MIDLHTHTNESDGSYTPGQLIEEAARIGLDALAITDHDTLAGYEQAAPLARAAGLELVCGIELSTKWRGRSVHLLGYFLDGPPAPQFREWLRQMQESRRERNQRLAERLRSLGMDLTLEEVERKGRSMTGRPHFARVMMEKGYVSSIREAFDQYLDESAKGYVERREPQLEEAIERIRAAGGLASLAHPVRVARQGLESLIPEWSEMGLQALEVYHSDHGPAEVEMYLGLVERFGLGVTGGSDFHGAVKPAVALGAAHVPSEVLRKLRQRRVRD